MPNMPSCCGPPALKSPSSIRSSTGCPTARTRCCCPAVFPNSSPLSSSANDVVRGQINELAATGAPVHAECAGLIYLVSELDGHPMCGVLAGSARFTPQLKLAYRDAVAVAESPLYAVGQRVVGHEFHRTAVTFTDSYQPAWVYRRPTTSKRCGTASCMPACTRRTYTPIRPRRRKRWCASSPTPPRGYA